ncbi:MAG TPA: hypothetical protein PKY82_14780 [Pyrinomonadaceae bacterium]|nr:hypothetical protein [Pyrinomonadaceae bacterium]
MKNIFLILALLFCAGCNQGSGQTNQINQQTPLVSPTPQIEKKELTANECKICDFDFAKYKGDLKKEEVEGLYLALNDEYMAMAIYDQINKDFNSPRPFINIQQAEARHSERLKQLFTTYHLPIPENPWISKTTKFPTVIEACKAGVNAEIVNKQLYDKLFKSTSRDDILVIYRNLQRASEQNHLPAFQRCSEGKEIENGRGRRQGRTF